MASASSVVGAASYDVSSWLIANTETLDGWSETGGFFLNTGAGGSHYNGTASLVAPFIEVWQDAWYGALPDQQLIQTLTDMPDGTYTLTADVIACWQGNFWNGEAKGTGVVLKAGDKSVGISTSNNTPETRSVSFSVSGGTAEIGIVLSSTNSNWVAIDNMRLSLEADESSIVEAEELKVRSELSRHYSGSEVEAKVAAALQESDRFAALEQLRQEARYTPLISPLGRAISGLRIGQHGPAYAESIGLLLQSVDLSAFGNDFSAKISYTKEGDGWGDLMIDGTAVLSGATYIFKDVSAGKEYTLSATNENGETCSIGLTFTSLPVVSLYGQYGYDYSAGKVGVQEPNAAEQNITPAKAKWRGGITNGETKHKRNYHVKLLDANGDKAEAKYFGLRKDNSWLLEACQVDMLRIRNRTLTDLWNDFASAPYYASAEPKALSATRGRFVELILNNEYRGIYCMTEAVDRKQMKLMKYDEADGTIHGMLWKAKEWSYAVFMGHERDSNVYPMTHPEAYSNYSDTWSHYELKYPELDDVSPTDWSPLYEAVDFVATSSDAEFREHVGEYFDMPVVIDYYVLMEVELSADNHGKNLFWACYDKTEDRKLTLAAWDMDATTGQRWSDLYYHSSIMRPDQDYQAYVETEEHGDFNLFRRLRTTDADGFNMKVRQRYAELRQTVLSTDSLIGRFQKQIDEFKACGADQREYAKWSRDDDLAGCALNFDTEMKYLTNWLTRRLKYLDETRFDIASLPRALQGASSGYAADIQVTSCGSTVYVQSAVDAEVGVYDLSGRQIRRVVLRQGLNTIEGLGRGLRIVGGHKVFVE